MNIPHIDNNLCTLCKTCIRVCPRQILTAQKEVITVLDNNDCLLCSHCYAACPSGAVSFEPGILEQPRFSSFNCEEKTPGQAEISPERLINFCRNRRSTRKYKDSPMPEQMALDVIEFGRTAPSGSNCQSTEFILVNGRDKVVAVAESILGFFETINSLARNPLTRYLSMPLMGLALIDYYRERLEKVEWAIKEYKNKGRDLLFWGAPCIAIMHSPANGSTPAEDAMLVAYNMVLLAQALGLGTCFIGYASSAINKSKKIKRSLEIPQKNTVHAVLTLGYPDISYRRQALRKPYKSKIISDLKFQN